MGKVKKSYRKFYPKVEQPRQIPDFATRERKEFIESVSPFISPSEKPYYILSWCLALVFGMAMPHERRAS